MLHLGHGRSRFPPSPRVLVYSWIDGGGPRRRGSLLRARQARPRRPAPSLGRVAAAVASPCGGACRAPVVVAPDRPPVVVAAPVRSARRRSAPSAGRGCRRGAPFAAAARALARRAASWDIGGRGGCGALGLGAVDLAARRVSWTARLMAGFIGRSWPASSDAGTAASAELRGASQSLGESATTAASPS